MPNRNRYFNQPIEIMSETPNTSLTTISNQDHTTLTGGMQFPFASGNGWTWAGNYRVSTSSTGEPADVLMCGFGSTHYTGMTSNNAMSATGGPGQITLANATNYPTLSGTFSCSYFRTAYFIMPCDATVEAIHFTALTPYTNTTPTGTVYPFVTLATCTLSSEVSSSNDYTWTLLSDTQTIGSEPLVGTLSYPYGCPISGKSTNLKTVISAGTAVCVIGGIFQTDNIGTAISLNNTNGALAYSGVVLMS